jgi:hypothetical protein
MPHDTGSMRAKEALSKFRLIAIYRDALADVPFVLLTDP